HTGAHKINNAIGQGLLAVQMKKPRVIAETGAGQHGVATATVAAHLGLECTVYMGTEDMARQALNVSRMRMLGAEVIGVQSGSAPPRILVPQGLPIHRAVPSTPGWLISGAQNIPPSAMLLLLTQHNFWRVPKASFPRSNPHMPLPASSSACRNSRAKTWSSSI